MSCPSSSRNASDEEEPKSDVEERIGGGKQKRKRRRTRSGASSNASTLAAAPAAADSALTNGDNISAPSSTPVSVDKKKSRAPSGTTPGSSKNGVNGKAATSSKEGSSSAPKIDYVAGIAKKYGVMPKMMRLQVGKYKNAIFQWVIGQGHIVQHLRSCECSIERPTDTVRPTDQRQILSLIDEL